MLFRVDPSSGVGLADQIAAQVRHALAAGEVTAGEQLPPARQVAAGLDVNMHTVLRAYQTLRAEGLIELRRGRGAVVRSDMNLAALSLDGQIRDLASAATLLGISANDVADAVRTAMAGP
ncbi:MAG: GntR family transcriptional regulator [Nakamurella sp.]